MFKLDTRTLQNWKLGKGIALNAHLKNLTEIVFSKSYKILNIFSKFLIIEAFEECVFFSNKKSTV